MTDYLAWAIPVGLTVLIGICLLVRVCFDVMKRRKRNLKVVPLGETPEKKATHSNDEHEFPSEDVPKPKPRDPSAR